MTVPRQDLCALPVELVERVIAALNRDVLSLPSTDEKIPGVPHACVPDDADDDESCELLHDQWVTRFGENPLAAELRAALRDRAAPTRPDDSG